MKRLFLDLSPVMRVSALTVFALVVFGAVAPATFGDVAGTLLDWLTGNFGWLLLLSVFVMVLFLLWVALSRYGKLRLGPDDCKPEFPFFTWIAMLFSTGFGAGLVFWGVAEPMSHFFRPPFASLGAETPQAARVAMGYAFFHWGLSQWAVFALAGLGIGLMQFRKQRDGLVSTVLGPVTGNRPLVKIGIDSLSVVATTLGVATTVGLGVLQIGGGMESVFGIPSSVPVQLLIVVAMFAVYMVSSATGLDRGMRVLSNINLAMCLVLLVYVFTLGPTVFMLDVFTLALGDYLTHFVEYSLRMTPYQGGTWINDWTIFYWAWAISWSPFVGAFVARVSRGRTIREFVMGVLVVPPALGCVWIAVFGGMALHSDLQSGTNIAAIVDQDVALALFAAYEALPLSTMLSVFSIALIFLFMVTSADSATYILASMATRGTLHPTLGNKLVWGVLMAAIAAVLLVAGGLESLQTAALVAALPFTVLLLAMLAAIVKFIRHEPLPIAPADLRRYRALEKEARRNPPAGGGAKAPAAEAPTAEAERPSAARKDT
ncbi:BCCT family transporter [Verticiella sediminum]|uniref:BCCT family transporter n=1 Tax=Verticiella sediminum TaxID=1247510 RepID=A0A556AXG8_9BURK|nr:BCCT family transporter [Verticiella sediminum]TSH97135.1 BCCT family transporter [Verticiella sediminum]